MKQPPIAVFSIIEQKKHQKYTANFASPFPDLNIPQPNFDPLPPPPEVKIPYGKLALIVGGAAATNLGVALYVRSRRTKNGKIVVERVRKKR